MSPSLERPFPLLELDVLRTFVAIVETGSFAAAAVAVFRTPSAVSMQIKKLEEMLGRPVLERDSRSVRLTRDGELLLEHARRMLALNRETMAQFITPDIAGVVRLGAPDDVAERFLPDMLRRFAESHPGITVNVIVENTNLLIDRVGQRNIDLALITCGTGIDGGANAEILFHEQLAWATVRGGVAAEQVPLPVSVWEECCVWRQAGLEGLDAIGRPYRIAFQSAYISGQRAAILADLAVAPIPVSAMTDQIVKADPKYGLPELPEYALGLILAQEAGAPVLAAADHLRASFSMRVENREAA